MRGLTPVERSVLAKRAGPVRGLCMPGSSEFEAIGRLIHHGRMTEVELEECFETHLTDLGRLALRVCPVDEF